MNMATQAYWAAVNGTKAMLAGLGLDGDLDALLAMWTANAHRLEVELPVLKDITEERAEHLGYRTVLKGVLLEKHNVLCPDGFLEYLARTERTRGLQRSA